MKTTHSCTPPYTDVSDPTQEQFGPAGTRWTCPERYCGKVWVLTRYREAAHAYREFHAVHLPTWRPAPFREQVRRFNPRRLIPWFVSAAIFFVFYSAAGLLIFHTLTAIPPMVTNIAVAVVVASILGTVAEKKFTPSFYGKARNNT